MTATKTAQQQHHHRSTLSQNNKPFKARHATKGSLKQVAKGRLEKESIHKNSKNASQTGQKANRKNQAKQLQAHKAALQAGCQKVFSGPNPAPRVIAILALSEDVDPLADILNPIRTAANLTDPIDPNSRTITFTWPNSSRSSPSLLQFLLIPHRTPLGQVLSTVAASDFLITSLSAVEEVTAWGESTLRSIQALGGPSLGTLGLVSHLESLNGTRETQKTRESLTSFLRYFFPESLLLNRIVSVDRPEEILVAIRSILAKLPNRALNGLPLGWREGRGRLVAEEIDWEDGTLKVTGHVRGGRFSANRLVHLPFFGDYRVSTITMTEDGKMVSVRNDEEADDLVSENCPSAGDELMAEQTWPTEEEIANAPVNQQAKNGNKKGRRVPVGTSEYQAAWILDEDGEGIDDEDEEDVEIEGDDEELDPSANISDGDDDDDDDEMEDLKINNQAGSSKDVHFMDLSDEAEKADLAQYRADRQRERDRAAKEDEEFPDEVDTPIDVPARQRFARYRGMKSLRTSEWDPYENLPIEYGKIFAFQGWKSMGRKLAQKANEREAGAGPGMYITLHIEQFAQSDYESLLSSPHQTLVAFSLLKHEHKSSVMHFTTQRNTEFEGEVKSKDPLIMCAGFRFYEVRPIWSQPSIRASNNVHKFERYLRPGKMNIGSVYMPVTFGSTTPILIFKQEDDPELPISFVGNGTLIGSEPQRIIAKRIVLTGHPYKVHKKTATIRYLFFNREDIEYFKPIELKTKKGKIGHIKEPLGTHGYFKAKFDGMIDQMDTICLTLYKRCFPKWSTTQSINSDHHLSKSFFQSAHPQNLSSTSAIMEIDN
ncbi:hypothetical protein MJO28_006907 [Puccinia striiformis f. sp. tritici]|uniref:Uncharacterized protein n=1 Tax=Puccinia striiformis f. sp. tritici TaxID=168172 RepID=A0ACC0EE62_9BASI|nr:hypothetical protein Pst134EA_013033 [Puccinia striiformis f. sp. tritici]KAH9465140.1 hypothetical protein Pst134EA_013033 [Puccinia striiformis f. sp. tritici]KAI7951223.1 hypothetical protein MJO28_006907 [Puccinia striiformis f. sp. tritici]KAI9621998.1 hypothetical protein H4Q26_015436 [Puccinia striiformis f. sp. tritici PST-130]